MAGDLNKVLLIGRLTRDPEIQQTSQATNYCRFSLALNRYYVQNSERKEEVSFINCVAWGRQAEVIAQYCQKGKQLGVEGRLKQSSWQDKEGQARNSTEIVVEQVQMLGGGRATDMNSDAPPPHAQEAYSAAPNPAKASSGSEPYQANQDAPADDIPF